MRRRHLAVLAVFGAAAAFVACSIEDLNPQPLPPGSGNEATFDASARSDAGGFGGGTGAESPADAGQTGAFDGDGDTPPSGEGGADSGTLDAGDGGHDATADADADGG